MYKKLKLIDGFTLIELLIVIAILAILASVATGIYTNFVNTSKCSEVEVAAHDTMLALVRALQETGTAPSSAGYATSHTIGGETLQYPTGVQVSYSGNGTQSNPFTVNAQRSNPACPKGDGIYTLQENNPQGVW